MRRRKAREARFNHGSLGKHHFESAAMREMIAIRGVAEAALHSVANQAALRTGAGGIHPKVRPTLFQESVELRLRDARLDGDISQFFVEIDDPVHAAEVQQYTTIGGGHPRAIAPVFAAA